MEIVYNFTWDKQALTGNAVKCKKPKMSEHRGRTWDIIGNVSGNDFTTQYHADTTWGYYGYFEHNGNWYKFRF